MTPNYAFLVIILVVMIPASSMTFMSITYSDAGDLRLDGCDPEVDTEEEKAIDTCDKNEDDDNGFAR